MASNSFISNKRPPLGFNSSTGHTELAKWPQKCNGRYLNHYQSQISGSITSKSALKGMVFILVTHQWWGLTSAVIASCFIVILIYIRCLYTNHTWLVTVHMYVRAEYSASSIPYWLTTHVTICDLHSSTVSTTCAFMHCTLSYEWNVLGTIQRTLDSILISRCLSAGLDFGLTQFAWWFRSWIKLFFIAANAWWLRHSACTRLADGRHGIMDIRTTCTYGRVTPEPLWVTLYRPFPVLWYILWINDVGQHLIDPIQKLHWSEILHIVLLGPTC